MTDGVVHIIGAGLAGLSAAIRLVEAGYPVAVYEAAKIAGGRCRSYFDPALGCTIDNGNHLVLSGNWAALDFLARIGAHPGLSGPPEAAFAFVDLANNERWTLRPNNGRLPWWIFDAKRRVPASRAWDYLTSVKLLYAPPSAFVSEAAACSGLLFERLWRPVLLAALNTEPSEADAGLAAQILRETLAAGGQACRPLIATAGLSATFIDPTLRCLARKQVSVFFGQRLRQIDLTGGRPRRLVFGEVEIELGSRDTVILAVPSWAAAGLIPELHVPSGSRAIVNAHFRIEPPPTLPPIHGIINGLAEWLFAYPGRLSVTISSADGLLNHPREDLAEAIWRDVSTLTGLPPDLPPWQIVKERRATFAATPAEVARRPSARTRIPGLVLAGDWTATGLPATIEGAIRSGYMAASVVAGTSAVKNLHAATSTRQHHA
ncbi:hydroxysqualene dehydroxylase HpnE [Microvirga alba]|uniref:FAD-dependent oxidoreductase n=1 Tax=Microvirga alba TaxID=2791025 RepID=A0A931BQY7_9HYPH|nr:hydroxysqualene dehydroxylase HpnE [Microvirga alba]MBF9235301.1 FAD-dependent oxidoreductase [Microvirga alba]